MLKPTLFLVLTLGLIGTWQVFDQVYVMSQGNPAKTTLTPAYLSYQYAFLNHEWGIAAAIAFVLFVIIVRVHRRPALRHAGQGRDRRAADTKRVAPDAGRPGRGPIER